MATVKKQPLPKPNSGCLDGIWCPNCGSYGPFEIHGTAWFKVYDDGAWSFEELDWENDSQCKCYACHYNNDIDAFRTPERPDPEEKKLTWTPGTVMWIWSFVGMDAARGVSAKIVDEFCPSCTKKSLVRWRGADNEEYESCLNGCCPGLSRAMGPIG